MNEKDVAYFGTLLNLEAKDVEAAAQDGTLGDKITALGLMAKDQVETLKTNYAKEVKSSHLNELIDKAKKGELDPDLYKPIKGAAYEMLEKELAKEYGVEDFNGVNDLVSKAINKNKTGKPDDKAVQELNDKIKLLQEANLNLVKEKDEAVNSARNDYESRIINRDKSDYINKIPFDFSDVEDSELDKISASRKKILNDVFDARYNLRFEGDNIAVFGKDGEMLKNTATYEPVPVNDVLKGIALELGIKLKSPESGGQGGRSSGQNGSKFGSIEEFNQYCEKNGIGLTDPKAIKLFSESGLMVKKQ